MSLEFQVGFDTDIGGGRENQDDFFFWDSPGGEVYVACVLDGHGREVGKIAANAARFRIQEYCRENFTELLTDPVNWLVKAHDLAHFHIKASFREELGKQGFEVCETEEGYLLKRKGSSQAWSCVHGGSSCSIVVIIGYVMYIANVGDSAGTLCTTAPVLTKDMLVHVVDAAVTTPSSVLGPAALTAAGEPSDTLMIIAEHSPESVAEFCRLRQFRHRELDPSQPALLVVYDSPATERTRCNPVFEFDGNGMLAVTNKGRYYKNVRQEWASLVSTPPSARFQDALAFTRSLGDLHLHTYGVTHMPEVQRIDLRRIFDSLAAHPSPGDGLVCLVLATDGVWDNWTYGDVTKFVLDPSCIGAVNAGVDGGRRVAQSFMQRNGIYAKRNFGAQADNATGIVLYLSNKESFPSQSPRKWLDCQLGVNL